MTTMMKLAAEAAKHVDSGISDSEFQDYDTLRYRANALKKGALGLAAASMGARAFVQNADVINLAMGGTPGRFVMNRVTPEAVKNIAGLNQGAGDVVNPKTIKQVKRFGRLARYGAIGAGIGSLAMHLRAKKWTLNTKTVTPCVERYRILLIRVLNLNAITKPTLHRLLIKLPFSILLLDSEVL